MATSADIGSGFSDYQGNPNLGGGSFGVVNLDTKHIQRLAEYTLLYKRSEYEQRQKDTDAKVAEMAKLAPISLNNLRGKDKEQLTKEFSEFIKYAGEFARKTPKTQEEKIQQQLEYQTKYGALLNNYNSGKRRAVSYITHANSIKETITDASTQDVAQKALDSQFDNTDIGTDISSLPKFEMKKVDFPDPVKQTFDMVGVGANENVKVTNSIYNPMQNVPIADAVVLGVKKLYPQKGSLEYNDLSPNEKLQADFQSTIDSDGKIWTDMTVPFNTVIQDKKYYNSEGVFDAALFEEENASNSIVMTAYNALKNLDKYSREKYKDAKAGIYNDKGLSFKLPPNLNPEDFKAGFINFKNGVKPNQLAQAAGFAKYSGDVVTKTIQETDNAIQRQSEAGANYRANLPYEKLKAGTQDAAAAEANFGNLIYGVNTENITLKVKYPDVAGIKNGAVVDKDGNVLTDKTGVVDIPSTAFNNSIITEYNKYVGGKSVTKSVDGVQTTTVTDLGANALDASGGSLKVRFENGVINGIYAKDGTLIDVDLFKHITMTAGQKGATKYKKPDTGYGKFNPDGSPIVTSTEYTNITETNKGKIGVKNGKWYDIKTGKEIK